MAILLLYEKVSDNDRAMFWALSILCALAIIAVQVLYGGAIRPVFALPGYLILGGVGVLAVGARLWRTGPAPVASCLLSALAFASYLIYREMHAPDLWLSAGYLRLTLACLTMYLVFACVVTSAPSRLGFFGVLFVMAMVQTIYAAIQFVNPEAGMPFAWLSEQVRLWYEGRISFKGHGFYLNGNHLAWFLNGMGIMALSLACWGRWPIWKKILALYVAGVCMAGAVLCLSRGGILSLAAGLASFCLLSAGVLIVGARDRRLIVFVAALACVLVAAGSAFAVYKSSFSAQGRFSLIFEDAYRGMVWPAVLRQFQLAPAQGTGVGTFLYWGRAYRERNSLSDDVFAHNDWMQLPADFGYPALGLLVMFCLLHFGAGYRGMIRALRQRMEQGSKPQSHTLALLLGALACLWAWVVHSIFDFNMQMPANALLAAALAGMMANPGLSNGAAEADTKWWIYITRAIGIGVLAGCAGWLLFLSANALEPERVWLRAENALLRGEVDEAEVLTREGLAAMPAHPRLHRVLGVSALRRSAESRNVQDQARHAVAAAVEFRRSAELSPMDGTNHLLEAEAWIRAGKRDGAREAALMAISLDPKLAQGYEFYAVTLEMTGRDADALRAFTIARAMPGADLARQRIPNLQQKLKNAAPIKK